MKLRALFALIALFVAVSSATSQPSKVWVADNGDGTYKNPIIHADYSDPDVIRVGTDYWMTASSFNAVPGLPVLHSKDLVNWRIVNHVFREQSPADVFSKPQHGGGVWAPAIRYHNGEFYIYYGDPDFGVYMTKTRDPRGPWSRPMLIKEAKGWIDPCPLWDADGNAYLVHAFAGSRAGIKSILVVNKMSSDGTRLLDDGVIVFDGHDADPTVEGPKFYKRDGYYYILAPAGGVATGWQLALRSSNIYGPYEKRVVLAQGKSAINGPHQGALVDTIMGQSWFVHFQDKGAYGRVVHLQPVVWKSGFPVIGADADGDGIGEPVATFKKPNVGGSSPIATPQDSDEFNDASLGLQWQWHANPDARWAFPFPEKGVLRMLSVEREASFNKLWDAPNLLLQKFPAEEFVATAKVTLNHRLDTEMFGLIVMGANYSFIGVRGSGNAMAVFRSTAIDADKGMYGDLSPVGPIPPGPNAPIYLRVKVAKGAVCTFSYSVDGKQFASIGEPFEARAGRWIGAKIGFVFTRSGKFNDAGSADIDWFRFEK